ncbi:hypothetical protein [Pseudonocardia xishanensis]|uniref:Uncharacterized protein n=1 Tax=Pseudonocardia xishanensis TaxID=630995 RepID=A0ABP8RVF1_9PSEU
MSERELTSRLRAEDELITDRLRHWARTTGDRTFLYYGEAPWRFAGPASSGAGGLSSEGRPPGGRLWTPAPGGRVSARP